MKNEKDFYILPTVAAVLAMVFALAISFGVERIVRRHAIYDLTINRLELLERETFLLEGRLRGRVNDIFILKGLAEEELTRNPETPLTQLAMADVATHLMRARETYDQVRLFEPDGTEVLRLRWQGGSLANMVQRLSVDQIKNKSDKSYFIQTLAASPASAVISPMELTLEDGKIVNPPKPTVRLSSQIRGPGNILRGVIVMNYFGNVLVRELRQQTDKKAGSMMLLDTEGYWLVGETPAMEWAFMDPARAGESLKKTDKAYWKSVNQSTKGWFFHQGNLICYRKIDPAGSPSDYPQLRMPMVGADKVRWILLEKVTGTFIEEATSGARELIWTVGGFAGLLLASIAWIGVCSIQRRREVIRELSETKNLFDRVINASLYGIVLLEAVRDDRKNLLDFKLLIANAAASKLLGRKLKKLLGRTILQENPASREHESFDAFCKVMRTGEPATFEQSIKYRGKLRWFMVRAAKLRDGVVVGFADITERKTAEEKLRRDESLLQITGRMAKIGGWELEVNREKLVWSREVYEICEVDSGFHPSLENLRELCAPEWREAMENALKGCTERGEPFDLELEIVTAKNKRIWVRSIGQPELEEGKLQRVYGTLQDITESRRDKKRLEEALAQEHELANKALAAEKAKSDFLATMSHEIRTPMSAVLGFAELLKQRPLPPEEKDYVQTIAASGEVLLRIIDDILDFSRIDSGRMELEHSVFSPRQILMDISVMFSLRAQQKTISLRLEVSDDIPPHIHGDVDRLQQILINLVGNAVKFTDSGEVIIGLRRSAFQDTESVAMLEFYVKDTGLGIAKDKMERIFEPFAQADSSISRRHGGTGLGLSICKRLADLMGGTLHVESSSGAGSLFVFRAPFDIAAEPVNPVVVDALPNDRFAALHPLVILIVEDNAVNMKLTCAILRKLGYEPLMAHNGQEAVSLFVEKHPDCILMDMQMPVMDGLQSTTTIREIEKNTDRKDRVFIAALTANVLSEERQKCLAAGMDDYLTKPLKSDQLKQVLAHASSLCGKSS
ncbi:MAG: ATP-binding protein [Chthoniobacterales bacterium]